MVVIVKSIFRWTQLELYSLFVQWVAANCAVPPTASAGQYATLNCKPLLSRFPCKWQYVNVGTLNLYILLHKAPQQSDFTRCEGG